MTDKIIAQLIAKAKKAQEIAATYTQEYTDEICKSIGWEVYRDENIEQLARLAVEETGMGNVEDKKTKHKAKILGVLRDIEGAKSVGLVEKDSQKGISKYAKPVGVVGALTPVTNPTATLCSNSISILKGRNSVIFAPHPKAKRCSMLAGMFLRRGLKKVGAPKDLIQVIEAPSRELTNDLMRNVDLIVATGGASKVKAAYSSGRPAFGVGPGNACQIIAEDADIEDAAKKIVSSASFDNATSCSSENSLIINEEIWDRFIQELVRNGSYLCDVNERNALEKILWLDHNGKKTQNTETISRSAFTIAQKAGMKISPKTTVLLIEGAYPVESDLFAGEKICPVMAIWKYSDFDEALSLVKRINDICGMGHSCGLFSEKKIYIEKIANDLNTSRILVRQPMAQGNGGNFFNGMPSTVSLGCGTWGNNITTENIHYKHFLNITWVSEPLTFQKPKDEEIWGDFWFKYGK